MRKVIGVYGNFEGLDADSSNKTKLPNRAKVCNNFWGHAGNLETRPGFTRAVSGINDIINDEYNQTFFLKCFSNVKINHGVIIQAGGSIPLNGKLAIRHNFLRD